MPWQFYRNLSGDDLQAIYVYLSTVASQVRASDTVIPTAAVYCDSSNPCPSGMTCSTPTSECVARGACLTDLDCAACQRCEGAVAGVADGGAADGGGSGPTPGNCVALSDAADAGAGDSGVSPLAACVAEGYPAYQ